MSYLKRQMSKNQILCTTLTLFVLFVEFCAGQHDELSEELSGLFTIEGKVYPPESYNPLNPTAHFNSKWQQDTVVQINSGEYKGFLREDGTFIISGVPSGSYVLEIHNPDYYYKDVRVDINPKGKFRAREVNYIQLSQIAQVPYPLKLKATGRYKYFQTREQLKITDFIFSPMVLMMVLPLLLMLLLPKMISDPETKKEIENIQFPKMTHELPEISEVLSNFFQVGDKQGEKDKKSSSAKQNKKRN